MKGGGKRCEPSVFKRTEVQAVEIDFDGPSKDTGSRSADPRLADPRDQLRNLPAQYIDGNNKWRPTITKLQRMKRIQ